MRKGAEVTWLSHSVAAVSELQHDTPGILYHPVCIVSYIVRYRHIFKKPKTSEDMRNSSSVCAQTEIASAEAAWKKAINFY